MFTRSSCWLAPGVTVILTCSMCVRFLLSCRRHLTLDTRYQRTANRIIDWLKLVEVWRSRARQYLPSPACPVAVGDRGDDDLQWSLVVGRACSGGSFRAATIAGRQGVRGSWRAVGVSREGAGALAAGGGHLDRGGWQPHRRAHIWWVVRRAALDRHYIVVAAVSLHLR